MAEIWLAGSRRLFSEVLESLAHHLVVDAPGMQPFEEVVGQLVSLGLVAASEDVQNQVTIFRPGMEGNMGLG
jgi:hypothetical protein